MRQQSETKQAASSESIADSLFHGVWKKRKEEFIGVQRVRMGVKGSTGNSAMAAKDYRGSGSKIAMQRGMQECERLLGVWTSGKYITSV